MNKEEVVSLLRNAVHQAAPHLAHNELCLESDIAALGLDSRSTLEIVGIIEDTYVRTFRSEELARLRSLGDIVQTVMGWV